MRTTVTLKPDLAEKLKEHARRGRRFVVEPRSGAFKPGVDPGRLNQLVDQLETEEFVRKSGVGKTAVRKGHASR